MTNEEKDDLKRFGVSKLRHIYPQFFTRDEKSQVMHAMKLLTDALDAAGVNYFLYGGSLIGSWRHHDIIPWDDDLDIIVNISDFLSLESLNISGHTVNVRTLNRYKFYNNNATDIRFWKWPFIDICFFGDNGTHIYDMDPTYSKTYVFDKNDIFPLVRRPFGHLSLKAPKHTQTVLSQTYNIDICKTREYDHRKEKAIAQRRVIDVNCILLHRIYPFVSRNAANKDLEKLYLDGQLLTTVDLHSINL